MRITLKIFAVIIALLSFWNLFSAERESYKVISRTYDGSSVQPVDVGISFFSEDLSNIQFEEDGICIKGDGYECYNGVIRAIQNNDMTELRKHALEHGFNEILKPVWLKNINSAFQEMKPELVKIVKFGDYKVFFVKFPREHDSKHRGFHISVKNIDGKDFWISYFEETLGYALGMIGDIKDQTVPLNGRPVNLFEETTRIAGAQSRRSIPDPPPATALPYSETMYLRFSDAYIGDLFIRGDISISLYGMTYSMTNFTDIRYSLFRIMRAERYSTIIYLEPLKEGLLIYSVSGLYLPSFIAKRINMPWNINSRVTLFINWITDGLIKQERMRSYLSK